MRSSRTPILILALAGMAVALPAIAQQASNTYPPACDASKVTKSDVDRAHTVFLSGKGFLDESNYDKAISYFKDAYSIDCSVHAILPIIATAYERKGDKASAIQALQEYLKRVPNASDREVVERRIRNLQDLINAAGATASTTAPAASSSAPVATAMPTAAPTAAPTATDTGAPTATSTSGPPPDEGGGHTVTPWIVVGVGGVAIAAGIAFFVVGSGDISTAQKVCGGNDTGCPNNAAGSSALSQGNTGRTFEGVGAVAMGVGGAAVIGGLIWHFVEPTGARTTGLQPVVSPGYAGLSLGGHF